MASAAVHSLMARFAASTKALAPSVIVCGMGVSS
jgi:hypothetical protein